MTEQGQRRVLGGRYELDEVLGYGGMAEVYHGHDVRLGREVAVKVLRNDLSRDPTFQARFRREAQAAASLNHPSIVSVYDTGQEAEGSPSLPYIVMEYVEGRTLREVLHEGGGRLTPDRALEIVAEVCGALEYSHGVGIVHRDIKPGNVMLTPAGRVKVMDFGIARAMADASSTMTQTAAVMGTAQYLSPEQAQGEPVDARSDVYSTGCLLYELLTGVPPFRGDSVVALAYQHVREDPRPPSDLDPDLSPDIDAVVLKALAKNPGNRYENAGEMRADLLRAASGERVHATPVLREDPALATRRTRLAAPVPAGDGRRRPPLALLLAGLLLLALLAGAFLLARDLLGTTRVVVPTVTGLPVAEARQKLEGARLKLGPQQPRTSNATAGTILEQSPRAQQKASENSSVDVVVSSGPTTVTVPSDLHGKSLAVAETELKALGLVARTIPLLNSGVLPGQVDTIDPAAGTPLPVGSFVTLGVAASATPTPTTTPTPPTPTQTFTAPAAPTPTPAPAPATTTTGTGTAPAPAPTPPAPVPVPVPVPKPVPVPVPVPKPVPVPVPVPVPTRVPKPTPSPSTQPSAQSSTPVTLPSPAPVVPTPTSPGIALPTP